MQQNTLLTDLSVATNLRVLSNQLTTDEAVHFKDFPQLQK